MFTRIVLRFIRVLRGQVRFDLAVMIERHRAKVRQFPPEHGRR